MSGSAHNPPKPSPLVTIALPVYNAGSFLRLAVASIREQSFTDWELLVIDDGSTDAACDFLDGLKDTRIHLLRDGSNLGLAARLNQAIDLARGAYLARMDQDDVAFPGRLTAELRLLEQQPSIDLVATRTLLIDQDDRPCGFFPFLPDHNELTARPWLRVPMPHPCWMGRISWFRRFRYADPGPYLCEDQELLTRAYPFSRFGMVDELQFAYRVRRGVNPSKLRKTHWAAWNAKRSLFAARGHWGLLALSSLALFARLLRDALHRSDNFVAVRGSSKVPHSVVLEGEAIIEHLHIAAGRVVEK